MTSRALRVVASNDITRPATPPPSIQDRIDAHLAAVLLYGIAVRRWSAADGDNPALQRATRRAFKAVETAALRLLKTKPANSIETVQLIRYALSAARQEDGVLPEGWSTILLSTLATALR